MKNTLRVIVIVGALIPATALAQRIAPVPLIGEPAVASLAGELSGASAKRNLEFIARQNRIRGSRQYRVAAEFVAGELRRHGLSDVALLEIPADGHSMYGTQKARPAWDPEFAELWEVRVEGGRAVPVARIASFEDEPIVLAEDSDSGEVTAALVDVGEGTSDADYVGKDVRGKLVLVGGSPGAAAPLAVDKYGAAGMISYAPNQPTAWWKEDENLIRWGHLDSFSERRTFAFMVSLKQARALRARLAGGETVTLHATVRAARHSGMYTVVTATLPGGDPFLKAEEIVLSCHFDHQRPGANDNASGCATILEIARSLSALVANGRLPRPARTIRFIWPAEVEGTMALFASQPAMRARFKAAIHMDMVGGGPVTKAVFHATRGPMSLPSFVNDIGQTFAAYLNAESYAYAAGEGGKYPFISLEGGKEPLLADLADFTMGSDHEVYAEGAFRVPVIYLNDWPDRYIHTNFDAPANIDATKLQRAAFIGAASALFLADLRPGDVAALWSTMEGAITRRAGVMIERRAALPAAEGAVLTRVFLDTERAAFASIAAFAPVPDSVSRAAAQYFQRLSAMLEAPGAPAKRSGDAILVFVRVPGVNGPMTVFGYDYLEAHAKGPPPLLLEYRGLRGGGAEYAYEVLSLVDGKRNAGEIRDIVSAEYGPVPLDLVAGYLRALEGAGVIRAPR